MSGLIDIVNFNSDASCLSSARWLEALRGGESSELCRWARLYVKYGKKVVLGFTGTALAEIRAFNPEVLDLVNGHPDIFCAVVRPFAHDIHLLRRPSSFRFNVRLGRAALEATLPGLRASEHYLPPEFMLTSEQVQLLKQLNIGCVFINAERFEIDHRTRIPLEPYLLRGLFGERIGCIPIQGALTLKYLHSLQLLDADLWNAAVAGSARDPVVVWRDGESCFLIPDGVEREEYWLAHESPRITRMAMADWRPSFRAPTADVDGAASTPIDYFPVHSFAHWMREFRMLGFLSRIGDFEDACLDGSVEEVTLWLALINSDVLSAVEKRSVRVRLRSLGRFEFQELTLYRTHRHLEAEEYLSLLSRQRSHGDAWKNLSDSSEPHMRRLVARAALVADVIEECRVAADHRTP